MVTGEKVLTKLWNLPPASFHSTLLAAYALERKFPLDAQPRRNLCAKS